jgi:hypothetical protein
MPVTKIALALIFVLTVSGCMTAWKRIDVPPSFDQSTVGRPAAIRGSRSGANGLDCYVNEPAETRELVTDPGSLSILVACYNFGGQLGEATDYDYAKVDFDAESGHVYEIVGYSLCAGCGTRSKLGFRYIEVLDVTNQEYVVIRRPIYGSKVDAIQSASMAVIILKAPRNDFHCELNPELDSRYGIGMLTPGVASYMVRCIRYNDPFGTRSGTKVEDAYEASMSFVALAGHVYKVDIDEKNPTCVQIFDVSREPRVIACVPAQQLEELIGRNRNDLVGKVTAFGSGADQTAPLAKRDPEKIDGV